jgi:aldehyde dehydrogenase (NAD(P)+)
VSATTTADLERQLQELIDHKNEWATLELAQKIPLLERVKALTAQRAEEWVEVAAAIKGLPSDSSYLGEEWASGPWALLTTINLQLETLRSLAKGKEPPLGPNAVRTMAEGKVAVKVFPHSVYDRLLFSGYSAEVWMRPEVTADTLASNMAAFYKDPHHVGKVALVLGAGNIFSISPLDIVHKLFGDGQVCLLKLHPVTDRLGPVLEAVFGPLIEAGYLAICYGGAEVGEYLTRHAGVDTIHVTGGAKTHDAIVFGRGPEGMERKARNEPLTTKEVTSELGNVTPTIVVPGPWTGRDIAYQAEHLATQKLHNSGFNCVASQVLVLSESWDRSADLVRALRRVMESLPPREPYYPAAAQRQQDFAAAHPQAELLGGAVPRTLVTGIDPASDDYFFSNEAFGPVYGQTSLPGDNAAEFLMTAVEFCNTRLWGTLAADILIHPRTIKDLGLRLHLAIEGLRYGTVGVNAWNGVGFLLGSTPWGAYPGSTPQDIQSGVGVVHNTFLFDKPEKAVIFGPFRPFPRTLASGSIHLSPKPQWFVTNRQASHIGRKITEFVADPGMMRLPGLFASALRG